MENPLSSPVVLGYLFVAVFSLIVLRNAYRLTQGVRVSYARLVIYPVFYVLIYAGELLPVAFAGLSSSLAIGYYAALAVDLAVFGAGVWFAYRHVAHHVELYRPEGASFPYYRIGALLPVVYVGLFVVRVVIGAVVLGQPPFAIPTPQSIEALGPLLLLLFLLLDTLWGLSTGFLLGRNLAVYRRARQWEASPLPSAAAP